MASVISSQYQLQKQQQQMQAQVELEKQQQLAMVNAEKLQSQNTQEAYHMKEQATLRLAQRVHQLQQKM
jgi:hypothetical protein